MMFWGLIGLLLICGGVILLCVIYQKETDKRDKEIKRLNIRLQHLSDYNTKILNLNDELLKEKQDLLFSISLLKDEKEDSK